MRKMKRKKESRRRGVSPCMCRAACWQSSWVARVSYLPLSFSSWPSHLSLLFSCICRGVHVSLWLLNCKNRVDEHCPLVECIYTKHPPHLGPRNGRCEHPHRGWSVGGQESRTQTLYWSKGDSGSSRSLLSHSFHLWSYGQLKHLHSDLQTQDLLPVLTELLYTQIFDTAMWRVEPVYLLIAPVFTAAAK